MRDESEVEEFLLEYYRGLCGPDPSSDSSAFDQSVIQATARRVGNEIHATVQVIDIFVTNEPVSLEFELSVVPVPGATMLLGLASPMPKGETAWNSLKGIRDTWLLAQRQPVFLNHLYVVPDAETYAAIQSSEFLSKEFS